MSTDGLDLGVPPISSIPRGGVRPPPFPLRKSQGRNLGQPILNGGRPLEKGFS